MQLNTEYKVKLSSNSLVKPILFSLVISIITACNSLPKAKESEAKNHLAALIRAEQSHWLEYNEFTNDIDALVVDTNPKYYELNIINAHNKAIVVASPIENRYKGKSFAQGIAYNKKSNRIEMISCKTEAFSKEINTPKFNQNGWRCGDDSVRIY